MNYYLSRFRSGGVRGKVGYYLSIKESPGDNYLSSNQHAWGSINFGEAVLGDAVKG
jgi:hypothetical protein